ncbi:hypothetical protein LTR22_019957 [Elasticomyces elasticus]|nr:hypothetical protein LTR22_019957 [Elasticomyces elasticus]
MQSEYTASSGMGHAPKDAAILTNLASSGSCTVIVNLLVLRKLGELEWLPLNWSCIYVVVSEVTWFTTQLKAMWVQDFVPVNVNLWQSSGNIEKAATAEVISTMRGGIEKGFKARLANGHKVVTDPSTVDVQANVPIHGNTAGHLGNGISSGQNPL